jgi:hypothetical protein
MSDGTVEMPIPIASIIKIKLIVMWEKKTQYNIPRTIIPITLIIERNFCSNKGIRIFWLTVYSKYIKILIINIE